MKINPKEMEKMMKQMGIKNEPIEAQEVIIKLSDKDLVVTNPNVMRVTMGGQESFQITGDVSERARGPTQEDVDMVASQAGVDEKTARDALARANGDIASAILNLTS